MLTIRVHERLEVGYIDRYCENLQAPPPGLLQGSSHRWPLKSTAGRRPVAPRAPLAGPPGVPSRGWPAPDLPLKLMHVFLAASTVAAAHGWPAGNVIQRTTGVPEETLNRAWNPRDLKVDGIEASNIMTAVSVELEEILEAIPLTSLHPVTSMTVRPNPNTETGQAFLFSWPRSLCSVGPKLHPIVVVVHLHQQSHSLGYTAITWQCTPKLSSPPLCSALLCSLSYGVLLQGFHIKCLACCQRSKSRFNATATLVGSSETSAEAVDLQRLGINTRARPALYEYLVGTNMICMDISPACTCTRHLGYLLLLAVLCMYVDLAATHAR